MTRSLLPIGLQTFREVRERGCYYVDKTRYALKLATEGKHYFLARPRRFGKSLFLDTLGALFEGSEALFRGLAVHNRWDWSARYPVVRLSFGAGTFRQEGDLEAETAHQLGVLEERAGLAPGSGTGAARLRTLIRTLRERTGASVAVLVDEYDKPIVDALDTPEVARANRDYLRGFYATIKECDRHLRFSFLTGVTKFSKVSLFSGLNNLEDITLDPQYSSICGYSDHDLDTVFAPELPGLDRARIREWYNGYSWSGPERVYNPYDVLLLFKRRRFGAYWFETGTPAFLLDTMLERRVDALTLEDLVCGDDLLSAFDVDAIGTEALLFQTGYLTIAGEEDLDGEPFFRLGYPNREVRQSLNRRLVGRLVGDPSAEQRTRLRLFKLLERDDIEGLGRVFEAFFAGIPHDWYRNNEIARYEGYYAAVVFGFFQGLGADVTAEHSTSRGRLDMAVRFRGRVYLFEFKVVETKPEGTALAQLKARGYADKYRARGEPIRLIGVEFSRKTRNVVAFDTERL